MWALSPCIRLADVSKITGIITVIDRWHRNYFEESIIREETTTPKFPAAALIAKI